MKAKAVHKRAKQLARNSAAWKSKIVRIGNSRGIRLPKALIEQAGLTSDIEIAVGDSQLIIRSAKIDKHPRSGWDDAMQKAIAADGGMPTVEDRQWLEAPLNPKFDAEEWTW